MNPHYRKNCKQEDLSTALFEKERAALMHELDENQKNRDAIEKRTQKQSQSLEWKRLRRKMLTASNFHDVYKRQKTTLSAKLVQRILFDKIVTDGMQYGIDHEDEPRQQLAETLKVTVKNCGFFIDPKIKFLGGSPDGLIEEELDDLEIPSDKIMKEKSKNYLYETVPGGIVEIKCPYSARNMTINQAKQKNPAFQRMFGKNDIKLIKTSHQYYTQMQGLLHCTRRKYCVFVIWTIKDMDFTVVLSDDKFWDKIENKLCDFYLYCLVPEIVDSRFLRNYPIREPDYVLNERAPYLAAREKKAKNKFHNILQRCIKAEEQDVNNEKTSEQNGTNEICKTLPRYKQNINNNDSSKQNTTKEKNKVINHYTEYIPRRMKKIKVGDIWTRAEEKMRKDILPPTEEELLQFQTVINSTAFLKEIKKIVINVQEKHDDACIDAFLKVLQRYYPEMEFLSVHHLTNPKFIKPCEKDVHIQIVGGSQSNHWRCFYYSYGMLYIYDSLFTPTFEHLTEEEKTYIRRRYPNLDTATIIPRAVTRQLDMKICGVFAGACAMTLCLNQDPSTQDYSVNQLKLRQHFFDMIRFNEITPFPLKSDEIIEID